MTLKEGATISNEEKLKVYGLYKQVTVGECSEHGGGQPWAVQVEKRAKWDAWNAVAGERCRRCLAPDAAAVLQLLPRLLRC